MVTITQANIPTPWGASVTAFKSDKSHQPNIFETGISWPVEIEIICRHVKPGMNILDVGANYGYLTTLFAALSGPTGHVVAVEPAPDLALLTERNAQQNSFTSVTVLQLALGRTSTTRRLWLSGTHLACHSLVRSAVINPSDSVEVNVSSLDETVASHFDGEPVDFIKIDAEGTEVDILIGATQTIERDRPTLWIECWPVGLKLAGAGAGTLLALLRRFRYRLTLVDLPSGEEVRLHTVADGTGFVGPLTDTSALAELEQRGIMYVLAEPL